MPWAHMLTAPLSLLHNVQRAGTSNTPAAADAPSSPAASPAIAPLVSVVDAQASVFARYYSLYWRAFYEANFIPIGCGAPSELQAKLVELRQRQFSQADAEQLVQQQHALTNHFSAFVDALMAKDATERAMAAALMHEGQDAELRTCTPDVFERWMLTSLTRRPLPTQRWLHALAMHLLAPDKHPHPIAVMMHHHADSHGRKLQRDTDTSAFTYA